jgi:glycosyltransferase involved in cell wall biosynthesis
MGCIPPGMAAPWLPGRRGQHLFLDLVDEASNYVRDRAMARSGSLRARLLFRLELLACRLARVIVLDTRAHADLFAHLYKVPADRLAAVFVGAEEAAFALPVPRLAPENARPLVLFYGQFIPLHGIATIVEAALSVRGRAFDWQIIGQGQEAPRIDALLEAEGRAAAHMERIGWVDYARLQGCMAEADVCLGIFGTSDKASRVIPNKVFQALAAGMPLITRDSPAMRELAPDDQPGLYLVEAGDPAALLDALEAFVAERDRLPPILHAQLRSRFCADAMAQGWRNTLELAIAGRHSGYGSVAA